MLAGESYYQKTDRLARITEERRLLSDWQATLLQTQICQQRLVLWLQEPAIFDSQYRQLQKNTDILKSLLSEVQTQKETEKAEGLQDFIKIYEPMLSDYIQKLETAMEQIEVWQKNSVKTSAKQKLLSNFAKDPIGFQVDSATNDLAEIISRAEAEKDAAREAMAWAQALRSPIITVSMALSAVIAALLAYFTSRAIARPLAAVTNIAQRVTEESNFELQVPVAGTDEVGVLATSLNQSIVRVNNLLAELKNEPEIQALQN